MKRKTNNQDKSVQKEFYQFVCPECGHEYAEEVRLVSGANVTPVKYAFFDDIGGCLEYSNAAWYEEKTECMDIYYRCAGCHYELGEDCANSVEFAEWCKKHGKHVVCNLDDQAFAQLPGDVVGDLYRALQSAVSLYGKQGGPWNVPGTAGSWLAQAKAALKRLNSRKV